MIVILRLAEATVQQETMCDAQYRKPSSTHTSPPVWLPKQTSPNEDLPGLGHPSRRPRRLDQEVRPSVRPRKLLFARSDCLQKLELTSLKLNSAISRQHNNFGNEQIGKPTNISLPVDSQC